MSYYLVPLGHCCMPAHHLEILGLRQQALPFDWLLSPSHLAIDYAAELIDTNFEHFLSNLAYDPQGKVFSRKYPEVKFLHHDLLKNESDVEGWGKSNDSKNLILAFERRVERFMDLIHNKNAIFINVFKYGDARLKEGISFFWDSVDRFIQLLEERRATFQLLIIFYNNEDFDLNELIKPAHFHHNVHIRKFIRETSTNRPFGCGKAFKEILEDFLPFDLEQ